MLPADHFQPLKKQSAMDQQNYHSTITGIAAAFESVQKRVNEWWTPDLEGSSEKPGDEFTVHFGDTAVTFKITELEINKKIVWQVAESYLPWLQHKDEWTGTSLLWEFKPDGDAVQISLTHIGLVPEIECYDKCTSGWNFFFTQSLYKLLSENKGMPNVVKSEQ
jgi:hypothetical protein